MRVAFPFAIIDASGGTMIPTLVNLVLASGRTAEIFLQFMPDVLGGGWQVKGDMVFED